MKPLFISSLYHPNQVGGAEKVARILAEGMLGLGHQPVVMTTQEGPGDRVADVNGVKVYYIGLKNLYWPYARNERSGVARALWHGIDRYNPLMARAVARVLDAEKPELVQSHNLTGFSCAVWSAVKARRLPLIHTLHDYSLMCPRTTMFRDGQNCQGQCTACALYTLPSKRRSALPDHVVGVSRFVLERHLACGYFPGRPTSVVHNALPGSPASALRPAPTGRPLQLGYVGQLTPNKGVDALIAQMSAWDSSQCQLVVAGRGTAAYETVLRERAPGNVRFLGFVDPQELYLSIDLLVVPSLWEEPLATTVQEAYMHGVPVIVSRRGGMPEIVDAGRTGLIYEPREPAGLQDAVRMVLQNRSMLHDMQPFVLAKANYFRQHRMLAAYLDLMAEARQAASDDQPAVRTPRSMLVQDDPGHH